MTAIGPLRLERKLDADPRRAAVYRMLGVVVAMLVVGLVLMLTGRNPFTILFDGFDANFGSLRGLEETGILSIPILMNALGVALALRMNVWNIGSDGQFLVGALAAVGVGTHIDGPGWLTLLIMAGAATAAGAVWMLVPALARAHLGVNEIITTLLLNFVAVELVKWAALGFWRDREAAIIQSTEAVDDLLPVLPGLDRLHVGFVVPLILAVILWWLFRSTKVGYEIDTIGGNPRAAAFAGIDVKRRIVVVMLVAGAIAGLAGMLQLSAPGAQRVGDGFSNRYGLSGFIVAAMAGRSFFGVLAGGVFIASLLHAGIALRTKGLSVHIILATYGAVLVGLAAAEVAARYRIARADAATVEGVPA